MTTHDLTTLTTLLHALYGDRFPGLTPGMAQLWYDDLTRFDTDLVMRAVKRWARYHTLKAPSLDELVEQIGWVQEGDRKARLPQSAGPQTPMAAFMAHVAATPARSTEDLRGAHAHQVLYDLLTGPAPRWNRAQCAAALHGWAAKLRASAPGLAASLERDATQFERYAAERGEEPVSAMTGMSLPSLGDTGAVTPLPVWDQPCPHDRRDHTGTSCRDCGEILEAAAAD